jgi:hypothetical protein
MEGIQKIDNRSGNNKRLLSIAIHFISYHFPFFHIYDYRGESSC